MDTSTDNRLVRQVAVTIILAASVVVTTWQVLFTGPGMGDNRYTPGRVSGTGLRGPAMQTSHGPHTRVVDIQQVTLPSGVPNAQ
jgi:hypothetical protein